MLNGAVGVKVTDADVAETPSGSVPVQRWKPLPAFGVAVTVTGVSAANHPVPDCETAPPCPAAIVPWYAVTSHCHSSLR